MIRHKRLANIVGWIVFAIAAIVYFLSAERTGSLWDCGEFILGAYKLQVVHPPGAPLFMLVGRMFAWVADIFSSNPADIAFAVNLLSGVCTAFAAMFVAKTTMIFSRLAMKGREIEPSQTESYAILGAGLVAGLATTFCSSIWFSAVEGEVYAMSTGFTALTMWSMSKWYSLPDSRDADRWLVFTAYAAGLSIGVHLLSLLTFPALALLFYFKKYDKHSFLGAGISMVCGAALIAIIQKFIIVGIPTIWKTFEIPMVNSMGLPFHSGLIPTVLLIGLVTFFLLRYAHKKGKYLLQLFVMGMLMVTIAFSLLGVIVIRANADTPINMNVPSDVVRLIPYLNREQYGERALLYGPHYNARPSHYEKVPRYGRVGDRYEYVDEKYEIDYKAKDKMLFPRVGASEKAALYHGWGGKKTGNPGQAFNIRMLVQYQLGWMYWRYFMWNFVGKQNGEQGYNPADMSAGHWSSGIKFLDEMKLYNMDEMPDTMKNDKANNSYYFLPLIFGLIGFFYLAKRNQKDFLALLALFIITGIGIIIYSNQPPNEPRERDYVLVGSLFTFCIWIGMAVPALYSMMKSRFSLEGNVPAILSTVLVMSAPLIMGFQNFDDHSRAEHYGSRDYASNFLESCAPNSIIFTYGDNDTYPLWYAQEVENIRTDVRVVNLSLIAVDWYINKLRSKVNDSAPLKLTIPADAYRGKKRNQVFFAVQQGSDQWVNIHDELKFIADEKNTRQGQNIMRTRKLFIPMERSKSIAAGLVSATDTNFVNRIEFDLSNKPSYIQKDELAVMDVIASNIYDRPIYFATTSNNEKLLGINDYMQLEGLGLRIIPVKTQSDRTLSIYGSGRVDGNTVYDNVMNKFKWGNFDNVDTHINTSYAAEIQSHRMVIMRAAESLLRGGQPQKAVDLSDKYFEAFPHFNFAYNPFVMPFINIYVNAGENEKAKKHMRILANEMSQYLNFFDSIDPDIVMSSFEQDYRIDLQGVREILDASKRMNDSAFADEMSTLLERYDIRRIPN